MIRLFKVRMAEEACVDVAGVLRSGYIGEGPKVKEFEEQIQKWIAPTNDLSCRYVVAANSATSAEHLVYHMLKTDKKLSGKKEVLTTPLTCLYAKQSVLLADGSSRTISDLVYNQYDGEIVSFNAETGQLENKKVIGWYKSPIEDRYWIRISFEHAGRNNQDELRGAWVTNEHKILTTRGYLRADKLRVDDEVVTSFRRPNDQQRELIAGSLLGDAGLTLKSRGHARFEVGHTIHNQDYIHIKHSALAGIAASCQERPMYKQTTPSIRFQSYNSPYFSELYQEWYPQNTKVISKQYCDKYFSSLSLAVLYMDDGCFSTRNSTIVLCTESFSKEDNQYLIQLLQKRFDITATLQRITGGSGYRLYIGCGVNYNNAVAKLHRLIAPFIVPSMRYKLSDEIESIIPFDISLYSLGESEAYTDAVITLEGKPSCQDSHLRSVYCIDIEDNHNFIASSIVVKNCTATNWPILANGFDIKWVDVDPTTLNMDLDDLARKITRDTAAIVVVHWGGYPVDMQRLEDIRDKAYDRMGCYPIIIQDCAHALGSELNGQPMTAWGDFATYSFQAIKHLTCGDGGALVTPHYDHYSNAKLLRWYGINREGDRTDFRCEEDIEAWGFKFHMNDIAATIGLANLPFLDDTLAKHRDNAAFYNEALALETEVMLLDNQEEFNSSYWLYTIRVNRRKDFMKMMKEKGVEVSRVHERNDKHSCVEQYAALLPNLDVVCKDMICIPVGWWITPEDRKYIVDCIKAGW